MVKTLRPGLFPKSRAPVFGEAILLEKRLDAVLEVLQVRIPAFRRPQSVIDETDLPKLCEQVLQSFALKAEVLLEPVWRRGLTAFPRVVEVPQHFGDDLHF